MNKYFRLLKIYRVANRYRLYDLLDGLDNTKFAAMLLKLPFPAMPGVKDLSRGKRLRLALEALGPIFIKFGQLLSTRRDMVPEDIADELAYLQDQVPPFAGNRAQELIEKALGSEIDVLFKDFSVEPLASASIAQVHTATLLSGEDIVIKVIRPGIDKIINQDISLLHSIAGFVEKFLKQGKRLHAQEIVEDYEHVINDELNLLAEAANTSQLRRNFENSPALYVPKVYWDYSRVNILVLERIYGIPVGQIDELKKAKINLKKLAETGVEVFFTQVFNHSFFHADMHPGNVFVSREHPETPQYIALDCAIMGSLSKEDQQYLARNLLAIFKRDYRKVAELHVECGWVPADTPVNAFEATMRSVCEPIFEKPLKDISFGMLLLQLFRTASRFNMEVQPSLVLLQKTLLNIEGLGKQLYPELDLWQTALPFLEDWQKRRLSPWENLKTLQDKLPEWIEQLPEMPELIFDALTQGKQSQQSMQTLLNQYEEKRETERRQSSRRQLGFGVAALAGAIVVSQPLASQWLGNISAGAIVLACVGLSLICFRR